MTNEITQSVTTAYSELHGRGFRLVEGFQFKPPICYTVTLRDKLLIEHLKSHYNFGGLCDSHTENKDGEETSS